MFENDVNKLQRHFDQTTSAFIGFLKSQMSDGFLMVHSFARATPALTQLTTAARDYARDS